MNLLGLLWLSQDFLLDLFCPEIQSWYSFPQLWAYQAFYEWATCWVGGAPESMPHQISCCSVQIPMVNKIGEKRWKRKEKTCKTWKVRPGAWEFIALAPQLLQFSVSTRKDQKLQRKRQKNDFQHCLWSPSHNYPMKSKIEKLAERRENVKLGKLDRQSGGLPLDVQTLHGPGAQEFTARSRCSQLLPLTNATQIQILNIYTHTHTRIQTNTHTNRDKHTHTHIQENTHTRTQTHRRIHILICNWHGHICCDIKWQSFKFSTFPSLGTI